jgi:hypothetical protein
MNFFQITNCYSTFRLIMFIIPNLQFLFFINQTNSWYRDLSRKFPISFHRRRNWLLCRRFAPRSRKRKIKKLSIPQKVCCVFPLTVCKQVKPPLLPRLCFIFLWTTRRASEVRFALMGQSLDFSSSFFLSLVSSVLCVYCVHTAEARASLTPSSACTNGRQIDG